MQLGSVRVLTLALACLVTSPAFADEWRWTATYVIPADLPSPTNPYPLPTFVPLTGTVDAPDRATAIQKAEKQAQEAAGFHLLLRGVEVENLDERRRRTVENLYRRYTGRTGDAPGIAFWIDFLKANGTEDTERRFANEGEALRFFVESLYADQLGRVGDSGGIAYWTSFARKNGRDMTAEWFRAEAMKEKR